MGFIICMCKMFQYSWNIGCYTSISPFGDTVPLFPGWSLASLQRLGQQNAEWF